MKKNIIFYLIISTLFIIGLGFFNKVNREVAHLSDLTNRSTLVYNSFLNLSKQINNAAVINPDLLKAGKYSNGINLFLTDSATIIHHLTNLKQSVRDSINLRIAEILNKKITEELPWLLASNVPDSILTHRASRHIAALQKIDLLLSAGIKRTNFLFENRKKLLNTSIANLRAWMLIFIILSINLLIYTTLNLFWQKSKRLKKEQELHTKELHYRETLDNMIEGIQMHDFNWNYIYVNEALVKQSTYLKDELLGHTLMEKYPGIENSDFFKEMDRCMRERISKQMETEFAYPNGTKAFFDISIQPIPEGIFVLSVNITERKLVEEKLAKTSRMYKFLSQINQSIVKVDNEKELLDKACSIATSIGEFKLAYMGLVDEKNKLVIASLSGDTQAAQRILNQSGLDYNDPIHKDIPAVKVMKTGKYSFNNDMQNDATLSQWKEEFTLHKIHSSIALPILKFGKVVGILGLHSSIKDFFDTEEILLLEEAAGDISFALENFEKARRHKQTEELIHKTENRFRSLIENSTDMKTLTNIDGNFIYGSPSVFKTFGYTEEEFIGKPSSAFFYPDDIPDLLKNRNKIINTSTKSFNFQYRLLHKNGQWLWCEGTLTNMLDNPSINALVSNFRNISEKKLAEQQKEFDQNNMNALINNTNDLLWSVDKDFKLISFNQPFNEMIKHITGKELAKGDTVFNAAVSNEQANNFKALYLKAFLGEAFTEIQHITEPMETWIELSLYPIKHAEEIIGTACHSRDITARRKAENEREKMIADIIQRNKNFEQFTYIVSHNLRAPVANILGISNVLKTNLSNEDRFKTQQFLFKAVEHLDEIVKDLNKILQTKTEITENKERVLLPELVRDIKASILDVIEKQNVKIETDFSMIDNIITLKSYIQSIFYNLISNSIKYRSDNKTPVIKIKTEVEDQKIKISFKDNGTGIDLEQYGDKIFRLYQRFHLNVEGKGLGLFMVKTQLEVLGGDIKIISKQGEGAEFIIELPLLVDDERS